MKDLGSPDAGKLLRCILENSILQVYRIQLPFLRRIHRCIRFFATKIVGNCRNIGDYKIDYKQLQVRSKCCPVDQFGSQRSRRVPRITLF